MWDICGISVAQCHPVLYKATIFCLFLAPGPSGYVTFLMNTSMHPALCYRTPLLDEKFHKLTTLLMTISLFYALWLFSLFHFLWVVSIFLISHSMTSNYFPYLTFWLMTIFSFQTPWVHQPVQARPDQLQQCPGLAGVNQNGALPGLFFTVRVP